MTIFQRVLKTRQTRIRQILEGNTQNDIIKNGSRID